MEFGCMGPYFAHIYVKWGKIYILIKRLSYRTRQRYVTMQILASGRIWDLVLFILLAVTTAYYLRRTSAGKPLPKIRCLPAFDAIEEGVGRAVETGKMVYCDPGIGGLITGPYVPMTLAGLNVFRYTARLCARRGARIVFGTNNTQVLAVGKGIMEEAYKAEGKIEDYRPDDTMYFPLTQTVATFCVAEGMACMILVGAWSTACLIVLGASARAGALVIGGTARWIMNYAFGICADYIFIQEDIYAAGALATGDSAIITTLAVEDVMKTIILVLIAIGLVAVALAYDYQAFMAL